MPNIKRPFGISPKGVRLFFRPALCWKCGKEIEVGTMNWSYNTHTPGKYAHRACNETTPQATPALTPSIPVQPAIEPPTEPQVEPKLPEPVEVPAEAPAHVLDAVRCGRVGMHMQCSEVISVWKQGEYPFLYGAPGAGKTTLIQQVAEQCQLDFLLIPCSQDMLRSEVLGTKNPLNGEYYPSHFYHCWRNGGIVLFDEVGLAAGTFLNLLNGALAQHELRFPNGDRIKKHEHCFIAFADNSNLWGTDPIFSERQDAGGAFRDRLTYIQFQYDTKLELHVIGKILDSVRGIRWHDYVLRVRAIVSAHSLPIFASPRFAFKGAKALKNGSTLEQVLDRILFQGLSPDVIGEVKREILNVPKPF